MDIQRWTQPNLGDLSLKVYESAKGVCEGVGGVGEEKKGISGRGFCK